MSDIENLPSWVRDNQAYLVDLEHGRPSDVGVQAEKPKKANVGGTANVMSSHNAEYPGVHTVMLDLDVEHLLIPSSTPGHAHLYINKLLSKDQYRNLLLALLNAGVIQQGILDQFDTHGATFLRLPSVQKGVVKNVRENKDIPF